MRLVQPNAHNDYTVMCMIDDGTTVGSFALFDGLFGGKKEAYLTDVKIFPAYRGKGYSKLLLKEAVELARQRSYHKITLHVDRENVIAHSLYTKFGFKITNRSKCFMDTMSFQLVSWGDRLRKLIGGFK